MPPQSPPKPETVTVTPDTHRNTETVTRAPNTVTPAAGSSEDELAEIVGEHQEIVRRIVDDQLVRTNTPARARVCEVIGWLAAGETWRQITHKLAPLSRPMWRAWLMHYPRFRELAHAAEDCGESIRRQDRIDSAHAKAVDGWKETGKYGEIQRYDSRLHQLLLEADDPAKYRSRSQDAAQVQIGVLVSFSPVASRRERPPESANQTLTVEPVEPVSP